MHTYLFYKFYLFFKKQKYRRNPSSKASGIISGLLLLNIYTVLSIIKNNFYEYTINGLVFISIVLLTTVLTSFVFNKKRLGKAIKRYSTYSNQKLILIRIFANLYIALSIILFFVFMDNLTN